MSYLAEALKHGQRPRNTAKDPEERKLGNALTRYANKSNNTYDPVFAKKIRELRPDWFQRTPDLRKEKLFELAKSGSKRPNSTAKDPAERKLGNALTSYTSKSSDAYDPVFLSKIRELRPDWFENTADLNKEQLLKLAKSGSKRPRNTAKDPEERKLGSALSHYTNKSQGSYDPVFLSKIRELRPDWFPADTKKKKLLELAKSGSKRPKHTDKVPEIRKLGKALTRYTSKSSNARDPAFDKKIRKLRPDWFINTADLRKEELLKLAKSGAKRPSSTAKDQKERKLGKVLISYISKSHGSYDPIFDKKIHELRPDWFINTADLKKEKLLDLAKSGGKRPSKKAKDPEERKLNRALHNYTKSGSYDTVFNSRISLLRPDWFRKIGMDLKKEELLKLAKSGGKRPSCTAKNPKERRLGGALTSYTKNSRSCDPIFDNEIQKLRPDWFINTADLKKKELLDLAKSGGKRPSQKIKDPKERKLGKALSNYTCKKSGSYDPAFDKKIRELRPDWFSGTGLGATSLQTTGSRSGNELPSQSTETRPQT